VNHFLLAPLLLGAAVLALPQDPDAKVLGERLLTTLRDTQLHFEKSPSGRSYKLVYEHEHGRKQTVFVATEPNRPLSLVVHNVYTSVWVGDEPPTPEVQLAVFAKAKKTGSFYLFESERRWSLRFGASFDATGLGNGSLTPAQAAERLKATIEFVNEVGEEVDRELNGERDVP